MRFCPYHTTLGLAKEIAEHYDNRNDDRILKCIFQYGILFINDYFCKIVMKNP